MDKIQLHFFVDQLTKTAEGPSLVNPEEAAAYKRKVSNRFDRLKRELEISGDEVGTGHKRIAIPKRLLTESDLKSQLGFVPVTVAIPEAGQTKFQSFRHPDNNYHIHDHGENWTMHEDRHAASTMKVKKWKMDRAKKKMLGIKNSATKASTGLKDRLSNMYSNSLLKPVGDFIAGAPHVVTEGIPGAYYYIKGRLTDGPTMTERIRAAQPQEYIDRLKSWRTLKDPNAPVEKSASFQEQAYSRLMQDPTVSKRINDFAKEDGVTPEDVLNSEWDSYMGGIKRRAARDFRTPEEQARGASPGLTAMGSLVGLPVAGAIASTLPSSVSLGKRLGVVGAGTAIGGLAGYGRARLGAKRDAARRNEAIRLNRALLENPRELSKKFEDDIQLSYGTA